MMRTIVLKGIKGKRRMMNKKKKILCYLVCNIMLLLFCIFVCKKDKITNKIEPTQKEYIENYFEIELPEKGNIIFYENNLNKKHYGGKIFVGLELNKSDRKELQEQINYFDKIDVTEEYEELFGFNKKDIKKAGMGLKGTVERFDRSMHLPMTAYVTAFLGQHKGKIYLYMEYSEGF